MLLNLNHKTLTADKLILRKKNLQTEKEKKLSIMQRNVHVLQYTLWNTFEHYCTVTKFETYSWYINTVPA